MCLWLPWRLQTSTAMATQIPLLHRHQWIYTGCGTQQSGAHSFACQGTTNFVNVNQLIQIFSSMSTQRERNSKITSPFQALSVLGAGDFPGACPGSSYRVHRVTAASIELNFRKKRYFMYLHFGIDLGFLNLISFSRRQA